MEEIYVNVLATNILKLMEDTTWRSKKLRKHIVDRNHTHTLIQKESKRESIDCLRTIIRLTFNNIEVRSLTRFSQKLHITSDFLKTLLLVTASFRTPMGTKICRCSRTVYEMAYINAESQPYMSPLNWGLKTVQVFNENNSIYKVNCAVQTHALQGSTEYWAGPSTLNTINILFWMIFVVGH